MTREPNTLTSPPRNGGVAMSGHTATPWRNACFQVYGADNSKIAHTGMGQLPPYRSTESEANAAFIVTACNSHADLVKALEEISKQMTSVELFAEHGDDLTADYETGYDAIIEVPRAALATLTARKVG